jgi:phosphopantothenoylcysteine decarboxylase/phosphopantothenate--cysteine ligase
MTTGTTVTSDSRAPLVVLGVSGSIAAYKAVEVARLLIAAGVRVVPIMTSAAQRFVGAATFAGICGERVHDDMWAPHLAGEIHVELGARADALLLVPATAELLAALAQGRADDLVRATALCTGAPIVAAPAMHPRMWEHPATRRNVALLASDGRVDLVGPVFGEVASGERGLGRMAEPAQIVEHLLARLVPRDLADLHLVVTAGPTREDLDPARFLSNRSSGRMGFAVAERAAARGAAVTLVSGPVALATPPAVERIDVYSARDMREALWRVLGKDLASADALVMTAAVADYRPKDPRDHKLKRDATAPLVLELVPNPDLLAEVGAYRRGGRPFLVGFALETSEGEALASAARGKLAKKGVDLVVANHAAEAFDGDDNRAMLVTAEACEELPRMSKRALADRILDRVRLAAGRTP